MSHLLKRRHLLEYFIGDLEPFILHPHLVDKVSCVLFLQLTAVWEPPSRLPLGWPGRDRGQSQQWISRVLEKNHRVITTTH